MERLEHEADALAAQHGQRVVVQRREVDAVDDDRAGVGALEAGDQVEQRRLADARLADDRDELAGATSSDTSAKIVRGAGRRTTWIRAEVHHPRYRGRSPTTRDASSPRRARARQDRPLRLRGMKRSATPLLQ